MSRLLTLTGRQLGRNVGPCISSLGGALGIASGSLLQSSMVESSKERPAAEDTAQNNAIAESNASDNALDNTLRTGPRPKNAEMLAAFTCNKCGGRTGIAFSKLAYEKGVVIARCGKCRVQHLISDQLGWFGEKSNIEEILKQKSEQVQRLQADGVLSLNPEDLNAWSQKLKPRTTS